MNYELKAAARRVLERRALMGIDPDEWWEYGVYTEGEERVRDARARIPDVIALVKLDASREKAVRLGASGGLLELWEAVLAEVVTQANRRAARAARRQAADNRSLSILEALSRDEVLS